MVVDMTTPIAIWDWEHEPQPPSARVVVCRPGGGTVDSVTTMMAASRRGIRFVQPSGKFPSQRLPAWLIPALYAERQADLAGVGALLTVDAERRALALCPREAMDLARGGPNRTDIPYGLACGLDVDIVVIIPPPEGRACGACAGLGRPSEEEHGDFFAHAFYCGECNGSGLIESWPMHPLWVRGIVEQCRAAGVPVAFLGWGEWCPISDMWPPPPRGTEERSVWRGAEGDHNDLPLLFYRVGAVRAGRTLNDEEVMELPEWLT
jgi:hypothetical protein